jgi:hypothetical protein
MTISVVDPYVFEPPGSAIFCTDSDPSIIKQTLRKSLITTVFCDFFMKIIFCWHPVVTDRKSTIRIRKSVVRIRGLGSGSLSRLHNTEYVQYVVSNCHHL